MKTEIHVIFICIVSIDIQSTIIFYLISPAI